MRQQGGARVVTSDYYSILGVTPAAEGVVIRAAYRALIRHYHPDTNPDPEAQKRAREITAAFAVLGDPARRAAYDAERADGGDLTIIDEPLPQRPPPAMRGAGIALATVALALVVTLFVSPQPKPPAVRETPAQAARPAETPKARPIEELEPESARLARLHAESGIPLPEPVTLDEALVDQPAAPAVGAPTIRVASVAPSRTIAHAVQQPKAVPAPPVAAAEKPKAPPTPIAENERLTTLNNMAAGFFSQSMAHADAAKKQLLLTSHTRSATARKACHSDSCVTQAYLRQMREISAIMEGRPVPEQ